MSPFYATHRSMLRYLADDFASASKSDDQHGDRLALYASILEQMLAEMEAPAEQEAA